MFLLNFAVFLTCFYYINASAGDSSPYYNKCVDRCGLLNCTEDGRNFVDTYEQPRFQKLMRWSCDDECRYECMWKTVDAFRMRKWRVPQFFGKWPFIRMLGMQEPASVAFSLLNFYINFKMLHKLRKDVPWNAPLNWMWHFFAVVCLNGWFWSAVFHARDNPFTEFMDYSCAFSMVLMTCYCMVVRLLRNIPRFALVAITTFFVAFFANHVAYLHMGRFDYGYNMLLNVAVGSTTAICWFGWCSWNRLRQPYVWKCAVFVALTGVSMLLEVVDRPPILWTFDFHSLWHLTSAPLTLMFYSFIIDDCKYLSKQAIADEDVKWLKKA